MADKKLEEIDCHQARTHLDPIRTHRRSQTPVDLRQAAEALGYTIDVKRGKGSPWWARRKGGPPFAIPTGRSPVATGTTTNILRILEKVYDDVCPRYFSR